MRKLIAKTRIGEDLSETVFLQGDDAANALSGNCGVCNESLQEHYELDAFGNVQMYADKDSHGDLVGFLCPPCAIDEGFKYAEAHGEWNPKRKEK